MFVIFRDICSVDDLRKLLSDKDHTINFCFHLIRSRYKIIVVSYFILIRDELRKETLQLARENLDKEPRIVELRNQVRLSTRPFSV
ncbi:Vacuolar protein-sorting-associated protein 37 homolog 2 [Linum perenne]